MVVVVVGAVVVVVVVAAVVVVVVVECYCFLRIIIVGDVHCVLLVWHQPN